MLMNCDDMDDYADLRAADLSERRRRNALSRNPDCRDPDHPGCECCMDEDTDGGEKS